MSEAVDAGGVRSRLAFKAYEIEELADRHFFRPAGAVLAHLARRTPLTANQLTMVGAGIGIAGGVLLGFQGMGLWGFGVLILHSIVDSADGQLARLNGTVTPEGQVFDGVGGYLTHISIFLSIAFGFFRETGEWGILVPMFLAGVCSAAHAQMYDYHRGQYAAYALRGEIPKKIVLDTSRRVGRIAALCYGGYADNQKRLAWTHVRVEEALALRYGKTGKLSQAAREAYAERFYWPVRGWNFMGDNTRFYAIGLFALLGALEHFFTFAIVVTNLAMGAMVVVQAKADRGYLDDLRALGVEDDPA